MDQWVQDVLFDPQTSGGLLIAVAEKDAAPLVAALHANGVEAAAIIGTVTGENGGRIKVE